MSNIIAGNSGGRGGAAVTTAITAVTLILILMASPVLLAATTTTTEAFAAPLNLKSKKDCKDIQIGTFEGYWFARPYIDKTVTIATSKHEYPVQIDYFRVSNDEGPTYYKNVGAKDPKGPVLIPGGKTITVTLQTQEYIGGGDIVLYKHKVSDCQILLGQVPASDKIYLKIVSVEGDREPENFKATVQVPNFSDVVGEQFTKLGVQFKYNPEVREYHIISNRVHVVR